MAKKKQGKKAGKSGGGAQKGRTGSREKSDARETVAIPDRRAMEGIMRQLTGSVDVDTADNPVDAAQQIMYEAFDAPSPREKMRLAKKALGVSPDCADAHVLLAELAPSLDEALRHFELGVAAGERALGKDGFEEFEGHFWGILETRPYMRARAGLADCLTAAGRHDEAAAHYEELLQLNPNDNQGVRYRLASTLLTLERHDRLAELLEAYDGDDMADWTYTRALLAFRTEGDTAASREKLSAAQEGNPHVPALLTGDKRLPPQLPEYISPGDENEAASYAVEHLPAWRHTPGAITWIRSTLNVQVPPRQPPNWQIVRTVLSRLPQADEPWEVDLREFGSKRDGDQCWAIAVADGAANEILSTEMLEQRPKDQDVWMHLLECMRAPRSGEPRRPKTICVRRKTYLKNWKSKLSQLQIGCRLVDSLPNIEAMSHYAVPISDAAERIGVSPDSAKDYPDIAELPQHAGEQWQADVRQLDTWIEVAGQRQRPWVVLVANATDDLILASDLANSQPDPDWLWQGVQKAICAPGAGAPHRPGVVSVCSEAQRNVLAPRLEAADVRCVVADGLPLIDAINKDLSQHLAGSGGPRGVTDSPDATRELQCGLFTAAAEFYREAPWRNIAGDTVIQIECDQFERGPWYAVVMGQSGMTLGLTLYDDLELLQSMLRGEVSEQTNADSISALSLTYGERFDIAARDLDTIERHDWPLAGPEAYPLVMSIRPGMEFAVPSKWELQLLVACLQAVPAFCKDNAVQQTHSVSAGGETYEMRLTLREDA